MKRCNSFGILLVFGVMLCAATLVASNLQAAVVTSVLNTTTPSGSTNRIGLHVTVPIFSAKDVTAKVQGTVNTKLNLVLNPFTGELLDFNGFELDGGRCLFYDDSDGDQKLELSWSIPFLAGLNVQINNMGCTFDTPNPWGTVTPTSNGNVFDFPTDEHEVIIDQGTADADGSGLAGSVDYHFDFATEPMNATTDGTGKLTIGNPSVSGTTATYSLQLELPIAVDETFPIEGIDGDVTISGSATFKATGTFIYSLTSVSLAGDLNNDGYVGSADLDIVRANWGHAVSPGYLAGGDCSGDGSVGSADLDIVRANWGSGTPPAAAVPEPSMLAVLLGCLLGIASFRRH